MTMSSVQPEDAKYIKRKVKSGSVDVHPTESALIVNYEVEAIILSEAEKPVLSDKKVCQKIIRLKSLNRNSDCAALAHVIVNKCSLIHPSKVKEVEHLIYFLQSRKENSFCEDITSYSINGLDNSQVVTTPERASFAKLEEYLELLYEDLPDKVRGSAMILQLSRQKDNLEELTKSDAVLSALGRVLREDFKKSLDLSTNIVSIFQSFSQFSQFHSLISQCKIGSQCITIIEYELNRYIQWRSELSLQREGRRDNITSRLPLPKRSTTPSPVTQPDRKKLSLTTAPKSAGSSTSSSSTPEEDTSQKKFSIMAGKQDKLLKASFSLLLNLSENIRVEDKIRKRNIVSMLIKCLDRSSVPLLIVVTKFLLKLSTHLENKDEMANLNIIEKIPKLFQMNNFELENIALSVLFNLSFDSKLRERMIRVGFLQKLVGYINDERYLLSVLKLLYHFSIDDQIKAMFPYTDCLPKLIKMINVKDREDDEYLLLISLTINVALNELCAESMIDNGSLDLLIQRAFAMQDPLLIKILRNLSMHKSTGKDLLVFAEDLIRSLTSCENEDFLLECVGTVANLPLYEIDIFNLIEKYDILSWIVNHLKPGTVEDDLLLEVIMLIAAITADESCAKLFCKADILHSIIELLKNKQEDDEIVLQIMYVFYQISRHKDAKHFLTNQTEAPAYLVDLMNDKNGEIRRICDSCIDLIKTEDPSCEERVKTEKFRWYNSHWLSMVDNVALETSLSSFQDYTNSPLPNYNLLSQSYLTQAGSRMSLGNMDDIEIISNNTEDSSRPLSRYDSDIEDLNDSVLLSPKPREDVIKHALRNLIIGD